jgi:uncharacterized protein (DUF2236 family)
LTSTTPSPTRRSAPEEREFDIRPYLSAAGALAGVANVIMQLSRPAVGYGVMESKVESGSAMLHPLKRARTTSTYLAVALLGDEADRLAFRRAVDSQHRQVRSGADSPVSYNAFSPPLQLWVAACLYYGMVDIITRTQGLPDERTADALYQHASRLGTTLQVRPGMWPADRAAFERYWEDSLAETRIDDAVGSYLMRLVRLENLPLPLRVAFGPSMRFWTTGFLPPHLRDQMGLRWSRRDQLRFDRGLRLLGRAEQCLPARMKALPLELLLLDLRRRVQAGRPLV